MDDILAAVAGSIPQLITLHGPTFVLLLLSVAANVVQYRDNKALHRQINEEIKAGITMAKGFEDTFKTAFEAVKDSRRSR